MNQIIGLNNKKFIYNDELSFDVISENRVPKQYMEKSSNFYSRFSFKLKKEKFDELKKEVMIYINSIEKEAETLLFKLFSWKYLENDLLKEHEKYLYFFCKVKYSGYILNEELVITVSGERCYLKDNKQSIELNYKNDIDHTLYLLRKDNFCLEIEEMEEVEESINDVLRVLNLYKYKHFIKYFFNKDDHCFLNNAHTNKENEYYYLLKELVENVHILKSLKTQELEFNPYTEKEKKSKLKSIVKWFKKEEVVEKKYIDSWLELIDSWSEEFKTLNNKELAEIIENIQQLFLLLLKEEAHVFIVYYVKKINRAIYSISNTLSLYDSRINDSDIINEAIDFLSFLKENTLDFYKFMIDLKESEIDDINDYQNLSKEEIKQLRKKRLLVKDINELKKEFHLSINE